MLSCLLSLGINFRCFFNSFALITKWNYISTKVLVILYYPSKEATFTHISSNMQISFQNMSRFFTHINESNHFSMVVDVIVTALLKRSRDQIMIFYAWNYREGSIHHLHSPLDAWLIFFFFALKMAQIFFCLLQSLTCLMRKKRSSFALRRNERHLFL